MTDPTLYQYPQKLVIFRNKGSEVLVARRAGETDYNGTYSYIGGKLETTDGGMVGGMRREKNEEVGKQFRIKVCPHTSYNIYYVKESGQHTITPHFYGEYVSGEIKLSAEYDDYKWVKMTDFKGFQPKIDNMYEIAEWALRLKTILQPDDLIEI